MFDADNPLSTVDILTFLLTFFVLLVALYLFAKTRRRETFKRRLQDLRVYGEYLLEKESFESKALKKTEQHSWMFLRKLFQDVHEKEEEKQDSLKVKFDKAGLRPEDAMLVYASAKLVSIGIFAAVAAFLVFGYLDLGLGLNLAVVFVGAVAGFYFVDLGVKMLIKARQDRIIKAFPDALDLMVICTEAGLSLTATIQRVAREISQISPDLGYELALLFIELNMMPDHQKALKNFSDRLDSTFFKSIIATISQAEQYGTPIAQTMRTVADEFRTNRMLNAEEKAARLPALLTLPMMLFIFPCIYLIVLGPAILNVMEHFHS